MLVFLSGLSRPFFYTQLKPIPYSSSSQPSCIPGSPARGLDALVPSAWFTMHVLAQHSLSFPSLNCKLLEEQGGFVLFCYHCLGYLLGTNRHLLNHRLNQAPSESMSQSHHRQLPTSSPKGQTGALSTTSRMDSDSWTLPQCKDPNVRNSPRGTPQATN